MCRWFYPNGVDQTGQVLQLYSRVPRGPFILMVYSTLSHMMLYLNYNIYLWLQILRYTIYKPDCSHLCIVLSTISFLLLYFLLESKSEISLGITANCLTYNYSLIAHFLLTLTVSNSYGKLLLHHQSQAWIKVEGCVRLAAGIKPLVLAFKHGP